MPNFDWTSLADWKFFLEPLFVPPLPHECQDFTADMELAGFLIGHDAFGCGNDGDAQAVQDAGQFVSASSST